MDQPRVASELRKEGLAISPAGVRYVWMKHQLQTFPLRLKALEKQKERDQLHGEIETAHSGYLGAEDTFYVGTLKGVGRIYQQTFLDTYAKAA